MSISKKYRLPVGVICTLMGAIVLKHSYSSPFSDSTPAELSFGNFFLFFYGPLVILWSFVDFPPLRRRL